MKGFFARENKRVPAEGLFPICGPPVCSKEPDRTARIARVQLLKKLFDALILAASCISKPVRVFVCEWPDLARDLYVESTGSLREDTRKLQFLCTYHFRHAVCRIDQLRVRIFHQVTDRVHHFKQKGLFLAQ